jgi:hypothetical protein
VATNSIRYQIAVRLDPLAQAPQLTMTAHPDAMIKTGTAITIHWPQPLAPCGRAGASIFIIRTPCSRGMPSSTPMYT